MKHRLCFFVAVFFLVISVLSPMVGLDSSVRAADSDDYIFTTESIYGRPVNDDKGNVSNTYIMCADYKMSSPTSSVKMKFGKLSDVSDTYLTEKEKKRFLVLYANLDGVLDYINQIGDTYAPAKEVYNLFLNGGDKYFQYLTWIVRDSSRNAFIYSSNHEYFIINKLAEPYGSTLENRDLHYNVWNPLLTYLDSEASNYSFSDYDIRVLIPEDPDTYQIMLAGLMHIKDTSLAISKNVIDLDGNSYDFNGEDDTAGFEVTIEIKEDIMGFPYAGADLTVTSSDGSNSVVTTDSTGSITLRIDDDETLTITGFDCSDYSFVVTETSDNMGADCNFYSISSNSGNVTNNSVDMSLSSVGNGTVDIVNQVNVTPTPTPTDTPTPTATEPSTTPVSTATDTPTPSPSVPPVTTGENSNTPSENQPSSTPTPTPSPTATPVPTTPKTSTNTNENRIVTTGQSVSPTVISASVFIILGAVALRIRSKIRKE